MHCTAVVFQSIPVCKSCSSNLTPQDTHNFLLTDALFSLSNTVVLLYLIKFKINRSRGELQALQLDWHLNSEAVGALEPRDRKQQVFAGGDNYVISL